MPTDRSTASSQKPKSKDSHEGLTTARGAFDLFGPSIAAFRLNLVPFLILLFVPSLIFASAYALLLRGMGANTEATAANNYGLDNLGTVLGALGVAIVVFLIMQFFVFAWLTSVQLKSALMQRTTLQEAVENARGKYLRLFLGMLLVSFIIALGFLLFIVPGFFMWKRYALVPYYIFGKNLSVSDAMKASVEAGQGENGGLIWGVIGVTVLVVLGGSIVASILDNVIPYLGTALLTILSGAYAIAFAIRYHQIEALKGSSSAKASAEGAASPLS